MEVKSRANVASLARLEIAREKTRMRGKRRSIAISELEQAAERWQRQKELEKRDIPGTSQRSVSG